MKTTSTSIIAISQWRKVCITTFFTLGILLAFGQTNAGKDFWLAQTPNANSVAASTSPFAISITNSSNQPANITITNPVRPTVSETIAPGAMKTFQFSTENLNILITGIFVNNVYHITSDQLIVVYDFTPYANIKSNDAAVILPTRTLGKKYMVGSYVNNLGLPQGSFFGVVAVENSTVIKTYDRNGGLVDQVSLSKGEYFQRMNGKTVADDVTGWSVEADKAVAVFSGNQCTSIGNNSNACDHIDEQVLPVESLAKTYVAAPTNSRPVGCVSCAPDVFRYVAIENGTTITTTPNVGTATLNKGEFLEISTSIPHIVQGNVPFYAYQYLISQSAGSPVPGTGDPSLLTLPVVDQFQFNYSFLVPDTYIYDFVNIVAPVGAIFTLDETIINLNWKVVGVVNGITYATTNLQVTDGAHKIRSNKKFGLTVSGFDVVASYAYLGGSGLQPINAGCASGGPYQALACSAAPVSVQLNATPKCSNGTAPSRIEWSSENNDVIFSDSFAAAPKATVPGPGIYYITLKVICGVNSVSCSTEIIVREPLQGCNNITLPGIIPPSDLIIPTDGDSAFAKGVNIGIPVFSGTAPFTFINNAPLKYPVGSTSVTWTAIDGNGITISGAQKITVIPNPVIDAPASVTTANDNGKPYATIAINDTATYTSLYGPNVLTSTVLASQQYPVGTTAVVWTITDGFGRTASDTQWVTVNAPLPTITAPGAVSVIADYDGFAKNINTGSATYTASVDPAVLTNDAVGQYPIGTNNIIWTITDGLGRTASAIQEVIVTAPEPVKPAVTDINIANDAGMAYGTVSLTPPAFQAVGPYSLTRTGPADGVFPVGETIIVWTVTDAFGKTASVSQKITVTAPMPTITAPSDITTSTTGTTATVAPGTPTYSVSVNDATVWNNAPAQFPIGSTLVTWTVKDGLGRTASASQTVTVNYVACTFNCTINSLPTSTINTGGNPNRLYLGYGAQSTKLQVNVPANAGGYTFNWTGNGLSSNTSAAPIFTASTAGSFTFTCKVKNNTTGCTSTSSITICVTDARSLDKKGNWDGKKVIVCHLPPGNPSNIQYIDVSINAVPTHVPNHGGDGLGNSCTQTCNASVSKGAAAPVFGVNVFPNPASSYFMLQVKSDDRYTSVMVRIMDAFGRTVQVMHNVQVDKTLSFGEKFANGAYYAEVIQGESRALVQLLKVK